MDREHEVFISYSHANRDVAEAVCTKLESHSIPCWMAPRNVLPGEPWGGSIITAIQSSRAMVVILSSQSNASPQVVREVERAVNHGLVVIPLRIEPVQPTADLEYFLSSTHWLDALTPDREEHLQTLYEIMRRQLQRRRAEAGAKEPAQAVSPVVETATPPEPETAPASARQAAEAPSPVQEAPPVLHAEPAPSDQESLSQEADEERAVLPKGSRSSSIAFILGCLGLLLCPTGVATIAEGHVWGWLLCLVGPAAVFLGLRENNQVVLGRSRASAASARIGMILGIFEIGLMLLVGVIVWIFRSLKM